MRLEMLWGFSLKTLYESVIFFVQLSMSKLPTALTGRQLKQSVNVFHNLKVMGPWHRVRSWLLRKKTWKVNGLNLKSWRWMETDFSWKNRVTLGSMLTFRVYIQHFVKMYVTGLNKQLEISPSPIRRWLKTNAHLDVPQIYQMVSKWAFSPSYKWNILGGITV